MATTNTIIHPTPIEEPPADAAHAQAAVHGNGKAHGHGEKHTHVTSPFLLLGVYGILLALTVLTVAVTLVDVGDFNVWLAIGIAVVKASLVALYFMHLRWDSPFNGAVLIFSFIFVAIFIIASVLDSHNYQYLFTPPSGGTAP